MEETGKNADKEAILACDRRNGRTEHEGKDNGRVGNGIAAGEGGQKGYAKHDRRDIPQGFSCGGEAYDGKDTSDTGSV